MTQNFRYLTCIQRFDKKKAALPFQTKYTYHMFNRTKSKNISTPDPKNSTTMWDHIFPEGDVALGVMSRCVQRDQRSSIVSQSPFCLLSGNPPQLAPSHPEKFSGGIPATASLVFVASHALDHGAVHKSDCQLKLNGGGPSLSRPEEYRTAK